MAANRQTDRHTYIHTHMRNEVTLVWGSLRLAPTTKLEGLRTTHCMGLLHGIYLSPGVSDQRNVLRTCPSPSRLCEASRIGAEVIRYHIHTTYVYILTY